MTTGEVRNAVSLVQRTCNKDGGTRGPGRTDECLYEKGNVYVYVYIYTQEISVCLAMQS